MAIPGYDLEDLDDNLRARIDENHLEEYLTNEELEQLESGTSLLDLLSDDDIDRIVKGMPRPDE